MLDVLGHRGYVRALVLELGVEVARVLIQRKLVGLPQVRVHFRDEAGDVLEQRLQHLRDRHWQARQGLGLLDDNAGHGVGIAVVEIAEELVGALAAR